VSASWQGQGPGRQRGPGTPGPHWETQGGKTRYSASRLSLQYGPEKSLPEVQERPRAIVSARLAGRHVKWISKQARDCRIRAPGWPP
jgi:hypothetical protein